MRAEEVKVKAPLRFDDPRWDLSLADKESGNCKPQERYLISMDLIPTDIEYRGNRIVWDARQLPGTPFWTGRAAVVLPPDAIGVKRIHRIPDSDPFASEQDVRDHLISAAKDWIDNQIEADNAQDLHR